MDPTKIKKLFEKITAAEPIANLDLENWDRRTVNSMTIAVREARDQIDELKQQYREAVSGSMAGVVVSGTGAVQFGAIAELEVGAVSVGTGDMYRVVASEVEPFVQDNRQFTPVSYEKFLSAIRAVAKTNGVKIFDTPQFVPAPVPTFDSLVLHVKDSIRKAVGNEMNAVFVKNSVINQAYAAKFYYGTLPVVITVDPSADEQEVAELSSMLNGRFIKVDVAKDAVNNEVVLNAFRTVKGVIGPKTTKTKKPEA